MRKFIMLLVLLVIASQCWADGYETKTIFVTDIPPDAIFRNTPKHGVAKLGITLGNCIRGTAEENDENKLSAMLEANIALYIAKLAYREEEARLNGKEHPMNDTKYRSAFKLHMDAQFKEGDLFEEAMSEKSALCRRKISYFFHSLADVALDINKLTKEGWEIKSTRRAWIDLWANKEIEDFEWGTEYILQKPIPNQKRPDKKTKTQGK